MTNRALIFLTATLLTVTTLQGQTAKQLKQLAYADPEFLNLHTWSMKGWLN